MSDENIIKKLAEQILNTSQQLDKQADIILSLMERVSDLEDKLRKVDLKTTLASRPLRF